MHIIGFFLSLCILFIAGPLAIQAHSHHHSNTYIVEQAPATVVVLQQAPVAQPVNVITVESQPPADIFEEINPSPGDDYVWQKGHWQ